MSRHIFKNSNCLFKLRRREKILLKLINMASSSKVWKPLVHVSLKQQRMNEKISPHMIGILYGCWNARGMSPHAEHLHNALSSLNGYKIEIKKQKIDEE